ncbi:hypothetical protein ABU614_00490 [Lysobacter firmicutimachus]|uniref:DUF1704 domain-containing protein n=1 Tax=Lysobacter firmicutimachus TaxID=1792846 RepID=A0AAU8MVW2_9GAMM
MSTLYAPVGITPTKPLTPSHLKGALLLDFMRRFEGLFAPGAIWHNRRPWDISLQTIRFWDYLDREHAGLDFDAMSEGQIGALYVECHRSGALPDAERIAVYARRIEDEGFVHAASRRILALWGEVFVTLGLAPDALFHSVPFGLGQEAVLDRLRAHDLLLDQRRFGGGVYLDLTDEGRPLRVLISEQGLPNYLLAILRDLLEHAPQHDQICLYHDASIERDYESLTRVLQRFGLPCRRVGFSRVPVEGLVLSAKQGGWEQYTGARLLERVAGGASRDEIRLGFRLYFLHALGLRHPASYSDAGLGECLERARRLLAVHEPAPPTAADRTALEKLMKRDGSANVYGALSVLEQKKAGPGLRHAVMQCLL